MDEEALIRNSYNMFVALMQIKSAIFNDPSQPIKNVKNVVDNILKKIDEEDVGIPVDLGN